MITILTKEKARSKKVMTARGLTSVQRYNTYVFTADRKGRFSALGYDSKVLSLYESNAKKTHQNTVEEFIAQGYSIYYDENEKAQPIKKKAVKGTRKITKVCAECGREFKPKNGRVKYCSDACREKHTKERLRMRYVKAKHGKEQLADES